MLQVNVSDGALELSCHGNLVCGQEAEAFQAAINRLLSSSNGEPIFICLSQVRKIDCAGLGVIAEAARHALDEGRILQLKSVSPAISRMLRFTRLDSILQVVESSGRVSCVSAA